MLDQAKRYLGEEVAGEGLGAGLVEFAGAAAAGAWWWYVGGVVGEGCVNVGVGEWWEPV